MSRWNEASGEEGALGSVMTDYQREMTQHYSAIWGGTPASHVWRAGWRPFPQECRILEFRPTGKRFYWVYATCGMTETDKPPLLEIFLMSREQSEDHVELLTAIAHYHQTGARLGLGHTVNFGRPWLRGSRCSFGLLSLPYTFGPALENGKADGKDVRVLWLFPITAQERALATERGLNALEELFEAKQVDYLNPLRESVSE